MICENCKQRPAKVKVTQMHNGDHFERNYCEVCANSLHPFYEEYKQDPLSLHQLLSNWFNHSEQQPVQQRMDTAEVVCEECGWTFQRFLNEGKFGCGSCYNSFRVQLPSVFKRLHNGNTTHIGKAPGAFGEILELKKRIEATRLQMKEAVQAENFEEAAKLRDEARKLESKLATGGDETHGD